MLIFLETYTYHRFPQILNSVSAVLIYNNLRKETFLNEIHRYKK